MEWPGPRAAAVPTCFSLYAYLRPCSSRGRLIDTKHPRLNMLRKKIGGGENEMRLRCCPHHEIICCKYQSISDHFSCFTVKTIQHQQTFDLSQWFWHKAQLYHRYRGCFIDYQLNLQIIHIVTYTPARTQRCTCCMYIKNNPVQ